MLPILLTFGAINALVPLMVIVILIAAGAGLMRGYDIFTILGISTLAGIGRATSSKGSLKKTSNPRPLASALAKKAQKGGGGGGSLISNKIGGAVKNTRNKVFAGTGLMGASSVSASSAQVNKTTNEIKASAGISSPKPTRKGQAIGFMKGATKLGATVALSAAIPGSVSFNRAKDRKTLEQEKFTGKYESITPELRERENEAKRAGITKDLKEIEDRARSGTPQGNIRDRVEEVLAKYNKINTTANLGLFTPSKQLYGNLKAIAHPEKFNYQGINKEFQKIEDEATHGVVPGMLLTGDLLKDRVKQVLEDYAVAKYPRIKPSKLYSGFDNIKKARSLNDLQEKKDVLINRFSTLKPLAITYNSLRFSGTQAWNGIKYRNKQEGLQRQSNNYERFEKSMGPGRLSYNKNAQKLREESRQLRDEGVKRDSTAKTLGKIWGVAGVTILNPPAGFILTYLAFKKKKTQPSTPQPQSPPPPLSP